VIALELAELSLLRRLPQLAGVAAAWQQLQRLGLVSSVAAAVAAPGLRLVIALELAELSLLRRLPQLVAAAGL
jgi:hypothetical protein